MTSTGLVAMSRAMVSVVVGLLLCSAAAHGQGAVAELRVRLETEADRPLAGALVALVDSAGRAVTEGLSGESGLRTLRAPPGRYRVRVRRIGYRPFLSEAVTLPYGRELRLRVESAPVVLSVVVVAARSQCQGMGRQEGHLATVWDEIAKALRATELSAQEASGLGRPRVYRKQVQNDGTVAAADTSLLRGGARRPFRALNASALATLGYVIGSETAGWEFFGVDETTLLSDEFRNTHCFRLVREPARRSQIGLAFDPVPRRPVADVAGVLWLDERTAELRELVYRYTNAGLVSQFGGSGYTRFRRMPSGAWLVDEWWLRMPWLERRIGPNPDIVAVGYYEHGGGLAPPDGR